MSNFITTSPRLNPVFIRAALIGLGLCTSVVAHAEVTGWTTSQIQVSFDPANFAFTKETGGFGGVTQVEVSPLDVSYSGDGEDGVRLAFNDLMSVYATSYATFSPETLMGTFNAAFDVTPQGGYLITGYTVTFSGAYNIETPGTVYVGSTTAGPFAASTGGGLFSFSALVDGPLAPALQGSFSATGDLATIQVFDGIEQVLDHYDTVLDFCEAEEPFTCYYREEPVYVGMPIYHDEMDLGEASVNLQSITVQAHVVAVPEPGVVAMAMGALPLLGWWARRRRV